MSAPEPPYAERGVWCPHGQHIYVPDYTDREPSEFHQAEPWPCPECDPDEVAAQFEDDERAYEAAWLESLT